MPFEVKQLSAEQPMIDRLVQELRHAINPSQEKLANQLVPIMGCWEDGQAKIASIKQIDILLSPLRLDQSLHTKHISEGRLNP